MRRDWRRARMKVDEEGVCRVCRTHYGVEAAHVIGRTHDHEDGLNYMAATATGELLVNPDRIVPLCGDHHRLYDSHQLDLLPYLHLTEVLQAVADSASGRSNGLTLALKRISGDELKVAA